MTDTEAESKRELELCMYPRAYGSRWRMSREDYDWLKGRIESATGAHREAMMRSLERAEIT